MKRLSRPETTRDLARSTGELDSTNANAFERLGWWQRIQTATPARRHKCEFCQIVFECHLCTITSTHCLHAALMNDENEGPASTHNGWKPMARKHLFRCVTCIETSERGAIVEMMNGKRYNELTGKRVENRKARKSTFNPWRKA